MDLPTKEINMPSNRTFEVIQKTDFAIKKSVVFYFKPWMPSGRRWTVKINSGWVMDDVRSAKSFRNIDKPLARKIAVAALKDLS